MLSVNTCIRRKAEVEIISTVPYSAVVRMFVYSGTRKKTRILDPKELIANKKVFFAK
jgi:hypothetical protein